MPLPDPGLTETGNGFMEPKYRKRFVSVMKDTPIMHWRSVSPGSQEKWFMLRVDKVNCTGNLLLRGSFGYLGYVDSFQGFFTPISGLYVPKS